MSAVAQKLRERMLARYQTTPVAEAKNGDTNGTLTPLVEIYLDSKEGSRQPMRARGLELDREDSWSWGRKKRCRGQKPRYKNVRRDGIHFRKHERMRYGVYFATEYKKGGFHELDRIHGNGASVPEGTEMARSGIASP